MATKPRVPNLDRSNALSLCVYSLSYLAGAQSSQDIRHTFRVPCVSPRTGSGTPMKDRVAAAGIGGRA